MPKKNPDLHSKSETFREEVSKSQLKLKINVILRKLWEEQTQDPAHKDKFDLLIREAEKRLQVKKLNYVDDPSLIYNELELMILEDLEANPPLLKPEPSVRIEHTQFFPPSKKEETDPFAEEKPKRNTRRMQQELPKNTQAQLNKAEQFLEWELELKIKNAITRLFLKSIGKVSGSEYDQLKEEAKKIDPYQIKRGISSLTRQELKQTKAYKEQSKKINGKQNEIDHLNSFNKTANPHQKRELARLDQLISKKQNALEPVQKSKLAALKAARETLLGLKTPVEMINSLQKGYDQGTLKRTQKSINNAIKLIKNPENEEALQLLLRIQNHLIKLESKNSSKAHVHKVEILNLLKDHLSGDLKDKQKIVKQIMDATKQHHLYSQTFFKSETDQIVQDSLKFLQAEPTRTLKPS